MVDVKRASKSGTLVDVIYRNATNGYTVGIFREGGAAFTGVGFFAQAEIGNSFDLVGEWKEHPLYGKQFSVSLYEMKIPDTQDGIELFLTSGAIKGVGPKTAKLIVDAFSDDALRVIADEPDKLMKINGIGAKKAAMIRESFEEHRDFAEITLFFRQYGISSSIAMRMYKIYGHDTIRAVKENPYQIIDDVHGMGFKSADRIALRMGIETNSLFRLKSGLSYILWQYAGDGSSFVPKKQLLENAVDLLDVCSDEIDEALLFMVLDGAVRVEELEGRHVVYLEHYHMAERSVCEDLLRLERASPPPLGANASDLLKRAEHEFGISLSESQRYAVAESLNCGVFVITGGPGTGKTTIIKAIIGILEAGGLNVGLAAPTGRAAKRMADATGHEAMTIHRLLEYYYSESDDVMRFRKNKENPLDYGAVVIDEASMLDISLMMCLLAAIRTDTRLLIVGDGDQLPSVGAGNVLRDMVDSELINSVRLTEIFRQAKESLIVVNAHRINRGEYPLTNTESGDFFLLRRGSETRVLETIDELCVRRLPDFYSDCDVFRDLQVITPTRKGVLGSINLNRRLQTLLNPRHGDKAEKSFGERLFREGDKVMQIKNNYHLEWRKGETSSRANDNASSKEVDDKRLADGEGVFNGDMGVIRKIDEKGGFITVVYDDCRFVEYPFSQIDDLELAYAVTVHKSQGNEFPLVLMPLSSFAPMLANRNLLYTAVTRGRRAVILVGMERHMQAMVDNNRAKERYSGLRQRLAAHLTRI